jgi:hypothetical protein
VTNFTISLQTAFRLHLELLKLLDSVIQSGV